MLIGKELIKSELVDAPILPGVYRMFDKHQNIIYIGKAKNLKNRLTQYTQNVTGKTATMVALVAKLEYNITETESRALILESQLIKKFKPKFNILLKDDKSFPYIKLRLDTEFPQLIKYRGKDLKDGTFFGPFASSKHVDITLKELQDIFKLRSCSDSFFQSRTRPCLQYQIKKCFAPCTGKIDKLQYKDLTKQVQSFFAGKNKDLQSFLGKKMNMLAEEMRYEEAAQIRDRIKALSYIQLKSGIQNSSIKDADFIAITQQGGQFCIQLFLYRQGQPCGNNPYFPSHTTDATISEVLEAFIMQLYQSKTPPTEIYLSHDIENISLLAESLREMHQIRVKISHPKTGYKSEIIDNAIENAKLSMQKHLRIIAKGSAALKQVGECLNMKHPPERIEVYDNSHIQGSHAIGAMIVATPEGFDKKEYRLYNIKEPQKQNYGGDDYAMLREVLTRRMKRIKSEPQRRPDLIIIDGGKGHLRIASEVIDQYDYGITYVAMSKGIERNAGREQFHLPGKEPFTMDKSLPLMKYLQILRDEAHNFAIKSHRNKRSAAIKHSTLDEINGIGEKRKRILLEYFGSVSAIKDATVKELSKVPGISNKIAQDIHKTISGNI